MLDTDGWEDTVLETYEELNEILNEEDEDEQYDSLVSIESDQASYEGTAS